MTPWPVGVSITLDVLARVAAAGLLASASLAIVGQRGECSEREGWVARRALDDESGGESVDGHRVEWLSKIS